MEKYIPDNYLIVAALDFGTTYSGYAFSTRNDFERDPLIMHSTQVWNAGTGHLLSLKTPTSILFDPERVFIAFGYEAENKYADMEEDRREYYYFSKFKMNLHNNTNLSTESEICDITGKKMLALDVFSMSIKALKDHFFATLEDKIQNIVLGDMRWVLTVPAIWSDSAKQFMRRSAEMAGIEPDKLLIALEPEAASIYCQHCPLKITTETERTLSVLESGTKYMVVDMGGGTVDITVHEKTVMGTLKEICRAAGGNSGGISVDFAFLEQLIGKDVLDELRLKYPDDYLRLIRQFEIKKRDKLPEKQGKPTIRSIIELIKEILKHKAATRLEQILLVGGFSECKLVQTALRDEFPKNKIIVPNESGLAVLRGAVLFGHKPHIITERISKYTYGFGKRRPFDRKIHDASHLKVIDGQEKCVGCFEIIIRKGEVVPLGKKISTKALSRPGEDSYFNFRIYKSEKENPVYTDDDGCSVLGTVKI